MATRVSRRRKPEEWRILVEAWRQSRKSAVEFATDRGVNPTTLGWWASELARRDRQVVEKRKAPGRVEPGAFLPVRVIGEPRDAVVPNSPEARAEIVLGGGRMLRIPVGADAAWVERVLTVLEGGAGC